MGGTDSMALTLAWKSDCKSQELKPVMIQNSGDNPCKGGKFLIAQRGVTARWAQIQLTWVTTTAAAAAAVWWRVQFQILTGCRPRAVLGRLCYRVRENHRWINALRRRCVQILQVAAVQPPRSCAGRLRAVTGRRLLPRGVQGGEPLGDHLLQLGRGGEAAPHAVLDDDGLEEGLGVVGVADDALVDHVVAQELGDHLQLIRRGGEEAWQGRSAARGERRGRQQFKLLPDVLARCWRLKLLRVEVLLLVVIVEIRLKRVVVVVIVFTSQTWIQRHGVSVVVLLIMKLVKRTKKKKKTCLIRCFS